MRHRNAFTRRLPVVLTLLLLWGCAKEQGAPPEAPPGARPEAPSPAVPAPEASPEAPAVAPPEALPPDGTAYYAIDTGLGRMVIRLYDETPQHRDNFRKLVAEGFYDGTTFHRVIGGFMVQGGDPNSKDDDPMNNGNGGPGYTVPPEIVPGRFHRRGVLAAARQGDNVNPDRRSSGSQFFIVHGGIPFTDAQLDQMEAQIQQQLPDPAFHFSPEARNAYRTEGGAPWLDGMYTIFGELVEGFDVLDRIAAVPTPNRLRRYAPPAVADQPLEPIPMTIRPLPPDYRP